MNILTNSFRQVNLFCNILVQEMNPSVKKVARIYQSKHLSFHAKLFYTFNRIL